MEGASRAYGSLLGHNDYGCVPCSGHLFYFCQASACSGVPNWTQPLSPRGRTQGARGGCRDSVMRRETRRPLTPITLGRLTVQKIIFSKVKRLGGSRDSVMSRETLHPLTPSTLGRLTVQKIFFSKVTRLCFVAGGLLAPGSSGHGLQVAMHTSGRTAR